MKQTSPTRMVMLGLIGIVFLVSGCQTMRSSDVANLDNTKFMSLWQTYNECKVASGFDQAHSGLKQLSSAASLKKHDGRDGFVLPLPTKLAQLVSTPPNRLAVDVQAMTASCSLHVGQLALHEGQIDAARDVFTSVLTLPKDLSPYYTQQAKQFLSELEQGVAVSLSTR